MGYRLEISEVKYTGECGGYFCEEDLHKCKSWRWLKERGYVDEEDLRDGVFYHQVMLFQNEFIEFIKLYIDDYNKYNDCGHKLSLDDFVHSLGVEKVLIEWC